MNNKNKSFKIYGRSSIGKNSMIGEGVIIGYPTADILRKAAASGVNIEDMDFTGAAIGDNSIIRSNSTIYTDVVIGDDLRTGHNIMVREETRLGDKVLIGTNTIIDGHTEIGSNVSIQGNVYIPLNVIIEDNVFIGPCAVLTNDKYPIRKKSDLKGPILRRGASIGANATILPGVEIGEGAMVAAGALVTRDVPPWKLAAGFPARIKELNEELRILNMI
ncbi:MAG: DapH/DapD/GlmU-related protein [Candidatus Methanoperedens sp.]|nr:DapH/DapD/GlmU-related protein [Candidatus Methanoperedens sp.]MCZ7359823.1 DapH/DapD/GlmU-related protein [Candidatus Methanoperedens sp.]HLB72012.1 DapH/DapD/GlmU-related protein [Candidatus Methanoperedens sp.]